MSSLFRIMRSASALWPLYLGVIVSAVVVAVVSMIGPFLVGQATDVIAEGIREGSDTSAILTTVLWLAVALFAADAVRVLVDNLGGYWGDMMSARLRQILSTRYYAKLLALPQRFHDNQNTGAIIARLDRSIHAVTQFIQYFSNNMFTIIIQLFVILGITIFYYWPLAVLLALLFPTYLWLTALTSKRWQSYEHEKNEEIDTANSRFAEAIGQVKITKSFVSEVRELASFGNGYRRTVSITRPQSRWWHAMDIARGLTTAVLFFGIYALIFWRTLEGHFSLGQMVMLIQLMNMAKTPVFMLSFLVDAAQKAMANSRDYFRIMDEELDDSANPQLRNTIAAPDIPEVNPAVPAPLQQQKTEPGFEFRNVKFAYEEGKPVLNDISLSAPQGSKIALIGESGGGKSTVVNLLLGLYQPQDGQVSVLGHKTAELSPEKLRSSVGVVFQEPSLFSGTIRENIAYGKPNASDGEIVAVARRANAHDFISEFPDGYDTVIGERGLRLSGGQKQRVAVARAMLKDAPLLILDEATSALDTKAERSVQAGLEELMKDRTTLIIAHRLSTIADVDTIFTLEKGEVVESGSPVELARSGGIYAQLLELSESVSANPDKQVTEEQRQHFQRYGMVHDSTN
ncbi:ABC transporter ATP-binding protein [Corynebacterium pseudodiphtheriticum]|uniref:ABC transporter ATP-binding protein n=1 Tax=Corynebacterium pseudodiphtheriticum TaxID=37637 RepID=UPI00234C8881|nr:ABC transporter ATP-binding protein [Corynebacterium pseudodiphtheriticum]MDC7111579.1 ABC transporter ATP-binding protein [Corynebacterium pseudodiphtheriticum]MDC7115530.1 ABC transporter ATP-binding protein [Corynebacterium pseudodiphtheriticum]